MNRHRVITPALDAETIALVDSLAAARGMTSEDFAAEAIRRVATGEADRAAFVKRGTAALARGDVVEHDAFVANLQAWRETRTRPA